MTIERTLSIVKPDAVAKGVTGEILRRFEEAGLRILAIKALRLTEEDARGFYAVHKDRPFYADLVAFMTSGPMVETYPPDPLPLLDIYTHPAALAASVAYPAGLHHHPAISTEQKE